jgi:predicted transcriptional regulator
MTFQATANKIDADAIRAEFETLIAEPAQTSETVKNDSNKTPFPVLSEKALFGLAGDVVRKIEPHTEADNAALLIQFLAGFGSLIGKSAYFQVGADKHFTKINAVIVGATARARKGTSWSEIERLLIRVDESFRECIQNGLSSGEGLIYHVRDERTEKKPIKTKGIITSYQDEIVDEGATEKRAFVIEPEFARVLQSMKREGNTLSSVIRQAWDTDRLRVMTKSPVKATEAHICLVGHITEIELIRNLDETESANGFANRFNWICARRSKYLPDGGNLTENDLNEIIRCLNEAVTFARQTEQMRRDGEANQLWHQVYKRLSDGYGGLLGSVTSRATAQVIRLACLYALLDCSDIIRLKHLEAALAIWQYCEDSAKYIFGVSSGDKVADEIFTALQSSEAGLSKTEISNLFNRNRTAKQIEAALRTLLELNRIEKVEEKTQGRPREVFKIPAYEKDEFNELSILESENIRLNSLNSSNSSGNTGN